MTFKKIDGWSDSATSMAWSFDHPTDADTETMVKAALRGLGRRMAEIADHELREDWSGLAEIILDVVDTVDLYER